MSSPPWVDGLTFGQVLDATVSRCGDHTALVFPKLNYRRTWREFRDEVDTAARALLALEVGHSEHVGIWATNWPEWVILQFAAGRIGAVLVNINPAYRGPELQYVLNQADISTLFLTDQFKTTDYFGILEEVCPELSTSSLGKLQAAACPKLRRVVSIKQQHRAGMWSWPEFLQKADVVPRDEYAKRQAGVRAGDVASVQYTSGTTGFPKGAMLTHRNLLMNAFYTGQRQSFSERDRLCIPVPLYHCFGCVLGTLVCVIYGATMVFASESFDALAALEAIHAERCTSLYGVPTMFIAELEHPRFGDFDLTSLRTGVMAGSPCPIEVMRAVVDKMGAREITIGYGLTEAAPIITQTNPTDSLAHRVGTVGTLLPGVEVRIVKPGTLEDVEPGEPGELIACGHGIMRGYYNKPKETADAITPDGWLHSGDIALCTPDGYYRITGRIKDMIIRGGENIYPREIEEFLYTHPHIADVQVVGLPDAKFGEEVCAWIRPKPGAVLTEDEIKDFCNGKMAYYKVPRYVVFVEEYPTTVTGKIQKFKLREMGVQHFGLHKAARIETA